MKIFTDLEAARKKLEICLSDEVREQYFARLKEIFFFSQSTSEEEFDEEARKLLVTKEQKCSHNMFIFAIMSKFPNLKSKSFRTFFEKIMTPIDRVFEMPDYSSYVQSSSPTMSPPTDYEYRSAASELFIPDNGFMTCRVAITCWQSNLDTANDNVAELMVHACQVFIKNIITAMISKKKGYKIRDGKFQYGFNEPVPDPFRRNFVNIIDDTQQCKVEVDDDTLLPKCKVSLEKVEQQTAFSYACAKRRKFEDSTLTVQLLYEAIKDNPKLLGLHSIHSVSLFNLGLHLENDKHKPS